MENEILIEKQEKIQTSSTISCPQPIYNNDILKRGKKSDWRGYKANSYGTREEEEIPFKLEGGRSPCR